METTIYGDKKHNLNSLLLHKLEIRHYVYVAYSFMKNVRGSPPYYQRTFYDLLAMIRQLGTPTWFLKWPDMISTIAKQYGVYYTDKEIEALSFQQNSNWLRRNPVTAAIITG